MPKCAIMRFGSIAVVCAALLLAPAKGAATEPTQAAVSAFNGYIRAVESRLGGLHKAPTTFLAGSANVADTTARMRQGEQVIEKLSPSADKDFPGAMVHDWRGTAFVRGATVADFERVMQDFNGYPQRFAPQVVQAKLLTRQGDHFQASMRVRQKHVITVVMDTDYDIAFARLDAQHGDSISRSTRIAEIDAPGTAQERALPPAEEHGFLWRLNTYWSYEERDGGLYMQIESVSLTRSIPHGLGWLIGPFVESVPRESLEFTLRSVSNALRK